MSDTIPPPLPPPPPEPPAAGRRTSVLAVVSLVFGLLGWSLLPVIGSVVAVITGHLARAEIRREPAAVEGDGLAIAGLVLGYALLAVAALTLLLSLLVLGGMLGLFSIAALAG